MPDEYKRILATIRTDLVKMNMELQVLYLALVKDTPGYSRETELMDALLSATRVAAGEAHLYLGGSQDIYKLLR